MWGSIIMDLVGPFISKFRKKKKAGGGVTNVKRFLSVGGND